MAKKDHGPETKFSVEEFNVHDELEQRLRASMANNAKKPQENAGTGNHSHQTCSGSYSSSTPRSNTQYSPAVKDTGQKAYLTPEQQKVRSKISDIELL